MVVESSLSESDESSQPLSSLLEEERFAQQTLYLDEPNMDEIQVKVRNQLPISQMEQVKHLFYINRAVCHKDFMENYIPRFGALIWTLRHEENWVIEKERCNYKYFSVNDLTVHYPLPKTLVSHCIKKYN